jgi:hypothetical protein
LTKVSDSNVFERRLQIWQKIPSVPGAGPGRMNVPQSLPKTNLAPRVINTAEPQIVASALRQVHPNNIGGLATLGKMEPKSRGIM